MGAYSGEGAYESIGPYSRKYGIQCDKACDILTITCQRILATIITLLHFLHCSGYHLRFVKEYPLLLMYKEGGIDIL